MKHPDKCIKCHLIVKNIHNFGPRLTARNRPPLKMRRFRSHARLGPIVNFTHTIEIFRSKQASSW